MNDDYKYILLSNPVYKYVAFHSTDVWQVSEEPYLRFLPDDMHPGESLYTHPIVYRSFATFPPSVAMNIRYLHHFPDPRNYGGATVDDVVKSMQAW